MRSGKSTLSVSLDVFFVDNSSINDKLRRLIAQFSLTPFCYVENQHLRNSILGEDDSGQNMALALQNLTVSTVPGQPGLLNARFSFVWFNYKPYTPNMFFKNLPFVTLPQKQPGAAFQLFYLPQLSRHQPVTFNDSRMTLSQFEFMITGDESVQRNNEISLDINRRSFDEFRNLLDDFVRTVEDVKASNDEQDSAELIGFSLDGLSDIALRLGGGDPTVTNVGGISRALQEAAVVAQTLQDAQIKTTNDLNTQKIQQLIAAQRNLITASTQIFSNGDVWLEFPSALLGGSNRVGEDKPSKLYFRRRDIQFGREQDGLIIEQISASHSNILALLPMTGYQYPTAQYLGSSDKRFSLRLKILDDDAYRRWTTFMNIYNNNLQLGKFIPQTYTNISVTNELFQFMSINEVMLEGSSENTVPDSPGLYDTTVDFVERGVLPENAEGLRAIPTNFGEVRRAVWDAIWRNIAVGNRGNLAPRGKGATEPGAVDFIERLIDEFLNPTIEKMLKQFSQSATNPVFSKGGFNVGLPVYSTFDDKGQVVQRKNAPDKISLGFKNILVLTALTDEEILGVEGLANVMWNWGDERPELSAFGTMPILGSSPVREASQAFSPIDAVDKETFLYAGGIDEARKFVRGRKQQNVETREERYKKIQAAVAGIEEYKAAIDRGDQIDTLTVLNSQGDRVKIDDVLDDAGLTEDFGAQVIKAGEKDLLSGLRNFRGRAWGLGTAAAFIGDQFVGDEQQDFIDDYLNRLRNELQELEEAIARGERPGDLTDIFRNGSEPFRLWPTRAREFADSVIYSDLIDLEMFAEAKEILKNMRSATRGHIYQDIPMSEIQNAVHQALGAGYPTGFRLEPDFYFINETADLNINSFVPEEQIEEIRNFSDRYTRDVVENNKNWYQQTYLKEIGQGFGQMLQSSSSKQNMESKYTDITNKPGTSQMKKPPSLLQSANNATAARDRSRGKKTIRGQFSLNTLPLNASAPRAQNTIDGFADNSNHIINIPNTIISNSVAELESSDQWIMPLEGNVRITSKPGFRDLGYGSKYHRGIDLATGPAGGTLGKAVFAAAEGEVLRKRIWDGSTTGPGNYVLIRTSRADGDYFHWYMHLQAFTDDYEVGDIVRKGQLIGFGGKSGTRDPHLHWEVRRGEPKGEIIWPFGSYVPGSPLRGRETDPIIQVPLVAWRGNQVDVTTVPGIAPSARGDTILEQSLKSMSSSWNKNAGYRMNRAYPGIYMSFIEEDTPGPILVFDAFFNYQSIVSCEVVRDREVAADYCKMVLTNVSGILSNRQFEGTFLENELINNDKQAKRRVNATDRDSVKEAQIESLMLREGIKVEVRMGYSDVPDKLSTVIVGRIVGVQFDETGDIVQIEIQSLATELVQDIKGVDKAIKSTSFLSDDANTGPLLENLISSPECVSFGMWKRGDRIANSNRDILTRRYEWDPAPQTDNIFAPDKEQMNRIDPGWIMDDITYRMYQMTIWDVFKEMELRHPEYIASPVPYEETNGSRKRMTMFFGLPDQLYFSRDPTLAENRRSEQVKKRREEIRESLSKTYKNGGNVLNAASNLLDASAVSLSHRQELIARLGNASSSPSHTNTFSGGSSEQEFKADARINDIVNAYIDSEIAKDAIESGAIQPFRKYHLLTSEMHIIANNMRARSSNTFNAVTVQYEDDPGDSDIQEGQAPEIDDAETITMKLDPTIPDEFVRENFLIFPNCIGEAMAKNYCVSLLQKGVWQTYSGEVIILGNPDIKPYDICYMHDSYTDMVGPFQVRRVMHYFSHETGFITVLTPDCIAYASEGTGLTQNQAMALMAEVFLKKSLRFNQNIITPGRTPLDGAQTTPILYHLAATAGQLVNFFGGKRMLFRTQFDDPIHVVPIFKQGKPMVAGFGPTHIRRNFFATKGFAREIKEAMTGLMEGIDDFTIKWERGLLTESRGRLFGENVRQLKVRVDE